MRELALSDPAPSDSATTDRACYRIGRDPVVRRRAIGSGGTPASVEEQQRRRKRWFPREASVSLVARDAPTDEEPALSRSSPSLRKQMRAGARRSRFRRGSDRIRIGYSRRAWYPIAAEKSANSGYRGCGSGASATSFHAGIPPGQRLPRGVLKIVVSPVRVRVSPLGNLDVIGVFYFLEQAVDGVDWVLERVLGTRCDSC